LAADALADKLLADITKFDELPLLPYILPFVEVRLAVAAVIVSAALPCVRLWLAVIVNVVPADDGPLIVVVPLVVSDMFALVAALAVKLATFVENALLTDDPPIPPLVDVRPRFVAFIVPVMLLLNRSFFELKLTVPTGVVPLPTFAPIVSVPLTAFSSTVELAFVLPASIVPVVFNMLAFVATKLKSLAADDAPLIVTVPLALSLTATLPFPALATTLATFVVNGDPAFVPTLPFNDIKLMLLALTVPVI
jgi:hypothetical protein